MSKQHIHIGVEDADHGFDRFVEAWHKAEAGDTEQIEIHLNFEDFTMLTSILTPKRVELMKTLRQQGPLSVRALAKQLERDYKNVHTDATALETVELIQRTEEGLLITPWDVIDTHVRLVA
ncbi:MAG: MarR family transcriptional regulator [Thiohalomonadales bacterium]